MSASMGEAVAHLLDHYLYQPTKELQDRSDSSTDTGAVETSINSSLLTLPSLNDMHPLPMKRMSPLYSQPVILRHASPTRKFVEAIKQSLWVAADHHQKTFF